MLKNLFSRGRPRGLRHRPRLPGGVITLEDLREVARYELECACRAAAQPLYLGDRTALSRMLGRYKIYLDTRDRGFAAHVMLDGYWEMWLTLFVARTVRPGMHVADVGANFGYYSLLMADLVGADGRLAAVEPNPAAVRLLARSLELNGFAGRTTLHACAAGAASGEGRLLIPEGEPKNAMLIDDAGEAGAGTAMHAVPIRSLDDLLAGSDRLDFLKIDTEGAEEDVMAGLAGSIARFRPRIVLEFNPGRCRDAPGLVARLRADYGAIRVLDGHGGLTVATDATLLDPTDREDRLLYLAPAS